MRVLVYGMVGTNRGGIETYLLKMNQYMQNNTIFDYVIEEDECLHEDIIKERGGNIYYITSRVKSPLKNISDNRRLLKNLKGKVDAVYFNLSSLSWIAPVKIAVKLGYRVYVHSHNAEFIAANSSKLHRYVNKWNKRQLSSYPITRLTCSKPATEFMFNPGDKVEMIYNAIRSSQFMFSESTRERIKSDLNMQNSKIIGFVGRLNDQKNPMFLPEIMKSVAKRNDDVKMIMLGDGPMKNKIQDKINEYGLQDRCFLLGNKTNVSDYLQAMDIFVLPSLHEGLPYVVVEAQTAGLRCLISDRITQEVNITGNVTFLPLLETADNWAEAILAELSRKRSDRSAWGDFMKKTNFNIENEAVRLENILRGIK